MGARDCYSKRSYLFFIMLIRTKLSVQVHLFRRRQCCIYCEYWKPDTQTTFLRAFLEKIFGCVSFCLACKQMIMILITRPLSLVSLSRFKKYSLIPSLTKTKTEKGNFCLYPVEFNRKA